MYRVKIHVLEAKDLKPMDVNGFSDPYVKISLNKQVQKTQTKKKTLTPKWDETFSFEFDETPTQPLEISIYDWDMVSKDDLIGKITLDLSIVTCGKEWYNLEKIGSGKICLEIDQLEKTSSGWRLRRPKRDRSLRGPWTPKKICRAFRLDDSEKTWVKHESNAILFDGCEAFGSLQSQFVADILMKKEKIKSFMFKQSRWIENIGASKLYSVEKDIFDVISVLETANLTEELYLTDVDMDEDGWKAIADYISKNDKLTSLILANCVLTTDTVEILINSLSKKQNFKSFGLPACQVGDESIPIICKLLQKVNISSLQLTGNCLSDFGFIQLAKTLKSCPNLEYLTIGGDPRKFARDKMIEDRCSTQSMDELITALKNMIGLKSLEVNLMELSDDSLVPLFNSLESQHDLENLAIAGNLMGSDGAKALSVLIQKCQLLTSLNISRIILDSQSVIDICHEVENHTTLSELMFHGCEINNQVAYNIARMIKNNTSLKVLTLYDNKFEEDGYCKILEALAVNSTLETLNLWNDKVVLQYKPITTLIDALKYNRSIKTLILNAHADCYEKLRKVWASEGKPSSQLELDSNIQLRDFY